MLNQKTPNTDHTPPLLNERGQGCRKVQISNYNPIYGISDLIINGGF